ncbi:MAG TPA: YggT family protein [Candidatus Limnocylindrales bacterium]|nr:YggT family protein [Candidatus Limnocylindrales bacterium]
MTYDDRRNDPVDPVDPVDNETRVVERQTYVERERPVAEPYPAQPASGPVNVNAAPASRGYAEPAGPGVLYYARRILSLLFGILAVLIGLRILLLLLVANQTNSIVDFVYNVTQPFVEPFRGIFAIDAVTPGGGSVFDIAALVALVGWLLIYLLLVAILRLGDRDRVSVA